MSSGDKLAHFSFPEAQRVAADTENDGKSCRSESDVKLVMEDDRSRPRANTYVRWKYSPAPPVEMLTRSILARVHVKYRLTERGFDFSCAGSCRLPSAASNMGSLATRK